MFVLLQNSLVEILPPKVILLGTSESSPVLLSACESTERRLHLSQEVSPHQNLTLTLTSDFQFPGW